MAKTEALLPERCVECLRWVASAGVYLQGPLVYMLSSFARPLG